MSEEVADVVEPLGPAADDAGAEAAEGPDPSPTDVAPEAPAVEVEPPSVEPIAEVAASDVVEGAAPVQAWSPAEPAGASDLVDAEPKVLAVEPEGAIGLVDVAQQPTDGQLAEAQQPADAEPAVVHQPTDAQPAVATATEGEAQQPADDQAQQPADDQPAVALESAEPQPTAAPAAPKASVAPAKAEGPAEILEVESAPSPSLAEPAQPEADPVARPASARPKARKTQCAINLTLTGALPSTGNSERRHRISRRIAAKYSEEVKLSEKQVKSKFLPLAHEIGKAPKDQPNVVEVARSLQRDLDEVQKSQTIGQGAYDKLMVSELFQKRTEFLRDKTMKGKCTETYGDTGYYEGEFLYGLRHGQGKHVYRKEVYEGEFKWDGRHGKGTLTSMDGSICRGEWAEGRQKGHCTVAGSEGSITYQGEFKDGKRHGHGRQFFDNGDHYDGGWREGFLHDRGTYYFCNGDKLHGVWEKGLSQGTGLIYHADGSMSRRVCEGGKLREVREFDPETHRFGRLLTREHMQKQTRDATFPKDMFRLP